MPVLVSFPLIYKLECWNFLPSHDGTINQIPPGIFKSTCKVKRHFLLNDILKCRRHFGFSDCPGGHHMVSVWWAELSPQIWHLDNTQRLSQSLARLVVTKLVLKGQCQEKIRYNFWANECFRTKLRTAKWLFIFNLKMLFSSWGKFWVNILLV